MTKYPMTAAIRWLKSENTKFQTYLYKYKEKGGARWAASCLGVETSEVIKTIVLEDENQKAFIVLMHGNCEVSTKKLAREISSKSTKLCSPQKVTKLTGYQVGGCSPFATKTPLPIYCEETIAKFKNVWINAGKRGFLIQITFANLQALCKPQLVNCAIDREQEKT